MLGGKLDSKPTLEPIDPKKVRSMRQNSLRASHSSIKDQRSIGGITPSLQMSSKLESVEGTPVKGKSGVGDRKQDFVMR